MGNMAGMRNLNFDDMHLFARVAELGSFSAVARARGVPVSQISRAIARIEKTCNARLVQRSTHALTLTPEGETFLGYCRRMTQTLDDLEGEFASQSGEASGWVRVAASTVMAEYLLVPSLEGLNRRHPRVRVELKVDDRLVDMVRDGVDIAIRSGMHTNENTVMRQIGTHGRRLYAAPAYLQAHGTPGHPEELGQHRLISNSGATSLNRWPFIINGQPVVITADGCWRADSTGTTSQLALQGLGIARFAMLAAEPLVRRGLLVPVLPGFVDEQPVPIHAVTLGGRHRLPKIRACIDYWAEWFSHEKDLASGPPAG